MGGPGVFCWGRGVRSIVSYALSSLPTAYVLVEGVASGTFDVTVAGVSAEN